MKMQTRFRLMLLIILALPVIFIMIASIFFLSYWYSHIEKVEDLSAPRMIRPQLKRILEGDLPDHFTGIVLVLDNEGEVVYLPPQAQSQIEELENLSPQDFYQRIMEAMPEEQPFSFSVYRYKNKPGLVIYISEGFPKIALTKIVWIILFICYLGFILLPAMALNAMIRPMMKSLLKLDKAAREFGKGNLDYPIEISHKKNHGLRYLENSLENMRKELKENHERQARIMLSISHDLKTPLTSIKGYVEAIQDGMASTPEDLQKYAKIIMGKSELLEERITELIHFSKIRTTHWQARFKPIEINAFMNETVSVFQNDALLADRKFNFSSQLSGEILILGDRRMLFQVLENLFDNANRFTEPGDSIRLRIWTRNETLHLMMEDSGSGIPREHQDKIFETFYRSDQGRNTRGMGIGLASARSIIESHGGSICYDKTELQGAAFHIELPIISK